MRQAINYKITRWPLQVNCCPEVVAFCDDLVIAETLLDLYKSYRPSNTYTLEYATPSDLREPKHYSKPFTSATPF